MDIVIALTHTYIHGAAWLGDSFDLDRSCREMLKLNSITSQAEVGCYDWRSFIVWREHDQSALKTRNNIVTIALCHDRRGRSSADA